MSTKRCRVCKYNTMEAYLDGLRPCSECDAGVFSGTYEEVCNKTEASFLLHKEDIKKGIMPDCIAEEGMKCRDCPVIREFSYCPWWDIAKPEEDDDMQQFDKELYIDYEEEVIEIKPHPDKSEWLALYCNGVIIDECHYEDVETANGWVDMYHLEDDDLLEEFEETEGPYGGAFRDEDDLFFWREGYHIY